MKLYPPEEDRQFEQYGLGPSSIIVLALNQVAFPPYIDGWFWIFLRLAYCGPGFIIYVIFKVVSLKGIHFQFGSEGVWWEVGEIRMIGCLKRILWLFFQVCPKRISWPRPLVSTSEVYPKCMLRILICASVNVIFWCSGQIWSIFRSLSFILIGLMGKFSFSFSFNPLSRYII